MSKVGPLMYAGIQYMLTQWPGHDGYYTIEGYNLFGDVRVAWLEPSTAARLLI